MRATIKGGWLSICPLYGQKLGDPPPHRHGIHGFASSEKSPSARGRTHLDASLLGLIRAQDQPDDVALALRRRLEAVELHVEEGLLVRHSEGRGARSLDAFARRKLDRKGFALFRADHTDEDRLARHREHRLAVLAGRVDLLLDLRDVG